MGVASRIDIASASRFSACSAPPRASPPCRRDSVAASRVLSAERDYDGWVFRALAFIEEGELVANFAAARASYRGGWGHRGRQANSSV